MNHKMTYAITVCNEHNELEVLLGILDDYMTDTDEVLIQSDEHNTTLEVEDVIRDYLNVNTQYNKKHIKYPLNNNFAQFKNNINDHAAGEWIFQIDADEYPCENLLTQLPNIIVDNPNIDAIFVPRVNTVKGITNYHVDDWGWNVSVHVDSILTVDIPIQQLGTSELEFLTKYKCVNEISNGWISYQMPIINFPDYQCRIYKNNGVIKWDKSVHEQLIGHVNRSILPSSFIYSIMHFKQISRQIKQNELYKTING